MPNKILPINQRKKNERTAKTSVNIPLGVFAISYDCPNVQVMSYGCLRQVMSYDMLRIV